MKNPGAGRANYGPGRYIRPPQILAGDPYAQPGRSVTKCPQIATKTASSATIRTRTHDKPQAVDAATGDGLVQTARKVTSEKLQLLGPDGRLALDRDGAATLRNRACGRRESGAGDGRPSRLDLGQEAGGTGPGKGAVQGWADGARREAPHVPGSPSTSANVL